MYFHGVASASWFGTIFAVICIRGVVSFSDEEHALLHRLLSDYDKNARPVANSSDNVTVRLDMALHQLFDVDERNQLLHTNAWMRVKWWDNKLTWDPANYSGLTEVVLDVALLWIPDIMLYNNAASTYSLRRDTKAKVTYDGDVNWMTPAMLKSSCSIDVTYFPFDHQSCPLQFASWVYNGYQIDIMNASAEGDTSNYVENGEWELLSIPIQRDVKVYSCCPEPYPSVTFHIQIKRKALYYSYNLILPVIVITAVTMLGFYLPPESGEKVSLGVTVLLAMTVFLLVIAESMPPTSEVVPLVGMFFGATIFLLASSLAMTVIVLNMHFRGVHHNKVPRWLRHLTLFLSRIVCMHHAALKTLRLSHNTLQIKDANVASKDHAGAENFMLVNFNKEAHSVETTANQNQKNIYLDRNDTEDQCALAFAQSTREAFNEQSEMEWRIVAMVIDRVFLFLFLLITVAVYVTILTNHP
ncbi:neuronal acetylcholine receptor subunit alpha-10 [Lingula anatina]|uniref:Neuronal acetylcholine receptor subunit alpha-10 n=1 Tax=Lingula anatina TaxID=7574 RepID=A0A1S3J8V0_LINAN|nr:neuronal acetylcholine receptor subunit alpha-10 [Lingula anatina]|eukprot:XP_013406738.1 neuronal acetylcholine receptor subunit alpha-10 [Lingula anatina]